MSSRRRWEPKSPRIPPMPRDVLVRQEILPCVLLALLAFCAYAPALRGEMVFDDLMYLENSPIVQADDGLYRIWCTTQPIDYYPLTHTTFWLEWRIWEKNPLGYHALNVALHAAAAILAWYILRRLKLPWAWLAAAVFVLHPVNVQAVAWISQRKSCLATAFGMAALLCFLHFDDTRKRAWYVACIGCCMLAHFGKSSMLMLPVVFTGYILWRRGWPERRDLRVLAPFYLLTLAFGLAGWWFMQHRGLQGEIMRDDNFFGRLITAGWAVWFYWWKLLAPTGLTLLYPKWKPDPTVWTQYLPGLALVGAAVLMFVYRRKWGLPLLVGLGYYAITIFPALGFFDVGHFQFSLVADHYQHQSMLGVIALIVAGAAWLLRRGGRAAMLSCSAALLIPLFALTWLQSHAWINAEALWRDTVAKNPAEPAGLWFLGTALYVQDRYSEAEDCFERAIALAHEHPPGSRVWTAVWRAYNDYGLCRVKQGDSQRAEQLYRDAIDRNPAAALPYLNLGNIVRTAAPERALALYGKAIECDIWYAEAYNNSGALLAKSDPARAAWFYQQALRVSPKFPDVYNNMACLLARQGRTDEAIECCRTALRLKPDFPGARQNLEFLVQQKSAGKPTHGARGKEVSRAG